jgi:hypothetical protein
MPIDWRNLDSESEVTVPAKPVSGLWTLVRTYVSGPQIIRLEADGTWAPTGGLPACNADGLLQLDWALGRDALLFKKAPLGALIGKIGGSIAGADDADLFLVGSVAVLTIDKAVGPLYLTINDAPARLDDNAGALKVKIS